MCFCYDLKFLQLWKAFGTCCVQINVCLFICPSIHHLPLSPVKGHGVGNVCVSTQM